MELKVRSPKGQKFNIKAKRSDVYWQGEQVTLYDIAKSESDECEFVARWIPQYLLEALDNPKTVKSAIVAIGDYMAGWMFL